MAPFLGMPDRVLIVPEFLDREQCVQLTATASALRMEDAKVTRRQDGKLASGASETRVTTLIKTFDSPDVFNPIVARAFRDHVEPAFGAQVEWFEWPDILFYRPGGRYDLHTDADLRDHPEGEWHRALDRDISLLIYLNDDFTGGRLEFPNRGEVVQPKAGMLVAFPSDYRFAHAALPVETGSRYVIVSWAAVRGSPRVLSGPRLYVVYPDRAALPSQIPLTEIDGAGFYIVPRRQPRI